MVTPELISYIKQQLANNVSVDTIKNSLKIEGNWASSDIQDAFEKINNQDKVSFKSNNIIALIFVILFIFTLTNQNEELANLLFFVMLIMGIAAASSFVSRMHKMAISQQSKVLNFFLGLISVGGAFAIFIASFIGGLSGVMRHVHGD